MSASDSDYSIDWLASDDDTDTDAGPDRSSNPDPPQRPEDDRGGVPDGSNPSPGRPDASQPPPTSTTTTTTCLQDPPRNHKRLLLSGGSVDIKSDDNDDSDCKDARRLNTRECSENSSSGGDSSSDCSSPVFLSKQNFWTGPVQGYYTTCRAGQHVPSSQALSTTSTSGVSSGMQKRGLHSPVGHCEPSQAEDTTDKELFSRKCMELQCYIQPLSSILRGLRSGRYSQRLSSFQESVAMDRIQRIMGVLQNPHMGERFMNIVLKMEAMLHSWFPQVKRRSADQDTADSVTPAKRQKSSSSSAWSVRPASSGVAAGAVPGPFSAALQLRWSHDTSLKTPELPPSALRTATAATAAATAHQGRGSGALLPQATQDNVVSSSTDLQNGPAKKSKQPPHPPRGGRRGAPPLPFKISSPCLQRLLQATESIIAPRTVGDDDSTACERSDS